MDVKINFTFDNGDKWTGNFESVSGVVCKPGENETQDVIIDHVENGQRKTTKIFWVIDFQILPVSKEVKKIDSALSVAMRANQVHDADCPCALCLVVKVLKG